MVHPCQCTIKWLDFLRWRFMWRCPPHEAPGLKIYHSDSSQNRKDIGLVVVIKVKLHSRNERTRAYKTVETFLTNGPVCSCWQFAYNPLRQSNVVIFALLPVACFLLQHWKGVRILWKTEFQYKRGETITVTYFAIIPVFSLKFLTYFQGK